MNSNSATSSPMPSMIKSLSWCPFWVKLLIFSLLIPTEFSFSLGALRLTPYRLVLLAAFIPALIRLVNKKAGPITVIDTLIFLHLFWAYIVINYYHGFNVALETGGIRMIELGGAYLIARTWIIGEKEFNGTVATIIVTVIVLVPFTLLENVSGFHLIKEFSAKLTGIPFQSFIEDRLGLARAYGPFDHPILLGVFAASTLGIVWKRAVPEPGSSYKKKIPRLIVIITAVGSLSSGALAALMTQFMLLFWDYNARRLRSKWRIFTALIILVYIMVDIISNRSGIKVFLHYLTFSAHTAYNRIIVFEWAIQDVWRNPMMGIGFNDWTRPLWMHSTSMDNFWLLQAVTFGIPGFITLALAVIFMLSRKWDVLSVRLTALRTGWTISMLGIIIAACTVHLWNNLFVYFAFFLGMGAWFHNVKLVSKHEH